MTSHDYRLYSMLGYRARNVAGGWLRWNGLSGVERSHRDFRNREAACQRAALEQQIQAQSPRLQES